MGKVKEASGAAKWWLSLGDRLTPKGLPVLHLRYHRGECIRVRGKITGWVERQVADYLGEVGAAKAVVKQYADRSFSFSNSIPDDVRQRIRNMLSSH